MDSTAAKISVGIVTALSFVGVVLVSTLSLASEAIPASLQFVAADVATPKLHAKAWTISDVETGELLYAENESAALPIASVTKLFAAAVFLEQGDLSAESTILWEDVVAEGRAGKLSYGETYINRDLLFPLLLESSNDAAEALARIYPELLIGMNTSVAEYEHTSFVDASGLSAQNVSTATELALSARVLFLRTPQLFDMTRLPSYYVAENGWINNSPFIDDASYKGGKHGFTYEAGRTSVAFFEEVVAGGNPRIIEYVILGSDDVHADMEALRTFVQNNTQYQ